MITVQSTADISLPVLEELMGDAPFDEISSVDQRQYFFKSIAPPSWVQFLASLETWQALLAAGVSAYATGFLGAAGADAWKKRTKIASAGGSLLRKLATKIVTLQSLVEPRTDMVVGVPISEGRYAALLQISGKTIDTIETELAQFSSCAPGLDALIARDDVRPVGWIVLELGQRGVLTARWMDAGTLTHREEIIRAWA
jgi:hypothetical protein